MEEIINTIAHVVFKVDTVLYKTFGFVSSLREQSWRTQGKRLQTELDRAHSMRDHLNALNGTCYTTKQALALQDNVL